MIIRWDINPNFYLTFSMHGYYTNFQNRVDVISTWCTDNKNCIKKIITLCRLLCIDLSTLNGLTNKSFLIKFW